MLECLKVFSFSDLQSGYENGGQMFLLTKNTMLVMGKEFVFFVDEKVEPVTRLRRVDASKTFFREFENELPEMMESKFSPWIGKQIPLKNLIGSSLSMVFLMKPFLDFNALTARIIRHVIDVGPIHQIYEKGKLVGVSLPTGEGGTGVLLRANGRNGVFCGSNILGWTSDVKFLKTIEGNIFTFELEKLLRRGIWVKLILSSLLENEYEDFFFVKNPIKLPDELPCEEDRAKVGLRRSTRIAEQRKRRGVVFKT